MTATILAPLLLALLASAPQAPVHGPLATPDDVDLERLLEIQERVGDVLPETVRKTVAIRVKVMGQEGFGSGAHIGGGLILTCAHVIEQSRPKDIAVVLSNGKEYEAERLGLCALNDYALLRIQEEDFPAFELGDSRAVRVGDWVGALGHPGGPYGDFQPAFSLGQVTGTGKKLPLMMFQKQYPDAIQSNVQIFGGNSGGPLFDLDGKLLGLNGAIIVLNESAFTIPTHMIQPHLDALKEGEDIDGEKIADPRKAMRDLQDELGPEAFDDMFGNWEELLEKFFGKMPEGGLEEWLRRFLERGGSPPPVPGPAPGQPMLGVSIDPSDRDGPGLGVARVVEGSGAERAGLEEGDRIVAFDGKPVASYDDLVAAIRKHAPGDRVKLSVRRDGWEKTVEVELMAAP